MKFCGLAMVGVLVAGNALALPTVGGMQRAVPESPIRPIPNASEPVGELDKACVKFAGLLVSFTEAGHEAELDDWRKKCANHPVAQRCLETVQVVRRVRNDDFQLVCQSTSSLSRSRGALLWSKN